MSRPRITGRWLLGAVLGCGAVVLCFFSLLAVVRQMIGPEMAGFWTELTLLVIDVASLACLVVLAVAAIIRSRR